MVKDNKIFNLNEIENIKEYLKFSNGINNIYIKTILADNYSEEYLTYKFPKVLFNDNNKNIGNLFWFFKIFAKKYLQNEFIDLDPLEEFNDAIEYLLLKSEISNNKFKIIWDNELEKIMNNGYLLIDALKPMFSKKNKTRKLIIKGGEKFSGSRKEMFLKREFTLETIKEIKNFFKIYQIKIWEEKSEMNDIIGIIENEIKEDENKKMKNDLKNDLDKKLEKIKKNYNELINCEFNEKNFNYLDDEIEQIKELINEDDFEKEIIEKRIKEIEDTILKFRISLSQNDESENVEAYSKILKKRNNFPSSFVKLLKQYSQLCTLIEEMKNIKDEQDFSNYMFKFSKISNIDSLLKAYKEYLSNDSEYKIEEKIEELYNLASSTLISNLIQDSIKYNLDISKFIDFLLNISKIEEYCIEDLGCCFNDEEYIYFPQLSLKNVYYCFRYGLENKYSGKLASGIKNNNIEPYNEDSKEDYFLYLIKKYSKNKINTYDNIEEKLKNLDRGIIKVINNILYVKNFFEKIKNLKINFDYNWLLLSFDELKKESWREPGLIIVKKKYQKIFNFENKKMIIYNGEKILSKFLYVLYESKKVKIKNFENKEFANIFQNIIYDLQKAHKNEFGYRILTFYKYSMYKDNQSETLKIIIKSIFSELEPLNKNIFKENSMLLMFKKYLEKCIIITLNDENPNYEEMEIYNFLKILLLSIYKKYQNCYENHLNLMQDRIKNRIKKYIDIIIIIEKQIVHKLEELQQKYEENKKNYNNVMNELIEKYNNDLNNQIFNFNFFRKEKTLNDIKKMYNCNISEPVNYKYDEKINQLKLKVNNLKVIEDLQKEEWDKIGQILKSNEIYSEYMDNSLKNEYHIEGNNLEKDINEYFQMIKKDGEIREKMKNFNYSIYNDIDLDIHLNIIRDWLNKLIEIYSKNVKFDILKFKKKNNEIDIPFLNNKLNDKFYNLFFIFDKENTPKFLNNNCIVNLGLYIFNETNTLNNKIGSIIFQNNFPNSIQYKVEKKNSENYISSDSINKLLKLNGKEDLNISFNLQNIEKKKIQESFIISLFYKDIKYDSCEIKVLINVIPFILKFKINERYVRKGNEINFYNYSERINIKHNLPGNYYCKKLGIKLTSNILKTQDIKLIQNDNEGNISLQLKNNDNKEKKCSLFVDLMLKNNRLFKLNFDLNIPPYFGLIVYDRQEDKDYFNISHLTLINTIQKDIYLFNMTYNTMDLNFKFNENYLSIITQKSKIEPGESLKLGLKCKNYLNNNNEIELEINNHKIFIKTLNHPIIEEKNNYYTSYIDDDFQNIKSKIDFVVIKNDFKNQNLKKIEKSKVLSIYLFLNGELIENISKEY